MNEQLIEEWINWYRAGTVAEGTLRVRRNHIKRLAKRIDLASATETDLVSLLAEISHQAPESRKSMMMSLRSFYSWALRRGFVGIDPTVGLRPITVPGGLPKPIPEHHLEAAIRAADDETRLMLMLGAYGGLRREEISKVHSDHVTPFGLVVTGKGSKVRRIPIHPRLAVELAQVSGWAFPSSRRKGQHVTADYVADRLEAVLPDGWTAHSLRHRFATQAYRGTHDLRAVQTLLGHSKPETTARYTLIGDDDLARSVLAIA